MNIAYLILHFNWKYLYECALNNIKFIKKLKFKHLSVKTIPFYDRKISYEVILYRMKNYFPPQNGLKFHFSVILRPRFIADFQTHIVWLCEGFEMRGL